MEETGFHHLETSWLESLQHELRREDSIRRLGHTIVRVPKQLRDINPVAYDPLVIPIGPYRKSMRLEASLTEGYIRISAANTLLNQQNLRPYEFKQFAAIAVGNVKDIMTEYERPPKYESEDALTALFALDASFLACFIVHLGSAYCKSTEFVKGVSRDFKLPRRLVDSIVRDVFILENQIPLSLLIKVMTQCGSSAENASEDVSNCINYLIGLVNPFHVHAASNNEKPEAQDYVSKNHKHLLDCLYSTVTQNTANDGQSQFFDSRTTSRVNNPSWAVDIDIQEGELSTIESAAHLRRAGIQFKHLPPGANVQNIFFDPKTATLFLPQVKIVPETESLLRNLAAYEIVALQRAELGSYLSLMDDLIDTAEDVELLRNSGVLIHRLRNDNEVADLWNSICKNLPFLYESNVLKQAYRGMKRHLKRRSKYKKVWELYADFSKRYLSAPWLAASVVAAAILLLLTVLETSYVVAAYYKSSSS
eukprot:c14119_g1_i1 orf=243-1679(-)